MKRAAKKKRTRRPKIGVPELTKAERALAAKYSPFARRRTSSGIPDPAPRIVERHADGTTTEWRGCRVMGGYSATGKPRT